MKQLRIVHSIANQGNVLISDQPLSLLLKASPLIDELSLYDVVNSPGVAADLSHICTGAVCATMSSIGVDEGIDETGLANAIAL